MTVQSKYFSPEPHVDSAIIAIQQISKDFFTDFSEQAFFSLVKTGFAHKRKMLIGNLKDLYLREKLEQAFSKVQLRETVRAEDISLTDWKNLIENL